MPGLWESEEANNSKRQRRMYSLQSNSYKDSVKRVIDKMTRWYPADRDLEVTLEVRMRFAPSLSQITSASQIDTLHSVSGIPEEKGINVLGHRMRIQNWMTQIT